MITSREIISVIWAARFATARIRASWRSRVIIVASVILTTVIGAMSPLYTSLVAQVGMVQRLDSQPLETVNITSHMGLSALDANFNAVWGTLDSAVRQSARTSFDSINPAWLNEIDLWSESAPMFVVRGGTDIPNLKLRAAYYENWENRVQVFEGEIAPSSRADIAGAVSSDVAVRYGFAVGDVMTLDQRGWATSRPFTVEITAVIAPLDGHDPFWMTPSPLRLDTAQNSVEANILVSRDRLLNILSNDTPQASAAVGWRFLFNHDALAFGRIPQAVEQVQRFEDSLGQLLGTELDSAPMINTQLPAVLTRYADEINLLNAPFGVLMLQVAGLVLFFLLITVTLTQRSERHEVAMLQNRGALGSQIMLLRAFEGLIICVIAALVAPFIARQALIFAAPMLTRVHQVTLELDALPFAYSVVTGLLALGVLLITLRPILNLPLISGGGTAIRAARQSWWQRYYLDLLLVIVGSAALFRLLAINSPFARSLLGGLHADPLLLIAPALLFIALGSVTLRLFPPLTDLIAHAFARRFGAETVLAAWSVSRDPAHYARLTFLLALAMGIGWFAISFQATLARSYQDQALYNVGSDVRVVEQDVQTNAIRSAPVDTYIGLTGVRAAANELRIADLNLSLDGLQVLPGQLLGVNADTFARTAYWRPDLGTLNLPSTPNLPESGVMLPAGTAKISVRLRLLESILNRQTGERTDGTVLISSLFNQFAVFARVRDADGSYAQVQLMPISVEGVTDTTDLSRFEFNVNPFAPPAQVDMERTRLQAALEGVSGWITFDGTIDPRLAGALTMDMLYWRTNLGSQWSPSEQRQLEFAALLPKDGQDQPLADDLLTAENWSLTLDNSSSMLYSQLDRNVSPEAGGWLLVWGQRQARVTFGIALYPPALPIPAVISAPYAADHALETGATFDLYIDSRPYTFVVENTALYFPTLYADQAPFVAADLESLLYALNGRVGVAYYPNETLISLAEGTNVDRWLQTQARTVISALTAADTSERLSGDVLMLGLSRLLLIAFIIALTLSIVSLLAYAVLTAQSRRDQFAVLRALGLSSMRIAVSVAIEQVVVFGVAAILGTVMGVLLSGQVLPTLAISSEGTAITPPFLVEIDPAALLQYGAVMIGLLALVLLVTTRLIRRMSLGQALRYGEE